MTFKLFISYSTRDLPQVELLQQQLVGTSIEVFVAEHSVRPSEDLAPRIGAAIAGCDLFVLLWSENAKASEWVPQEIGRATALGKQILPLVLSDTVTLPGFIQSLKYLAVHKDPAGSFQAARKMILEEYEKKNTAIAAAVKEKSEKDALTLVGIASSWHGRSANNPMPLRMRIRSYPNSVLLQRVCQTNRQSRHASPSYTSPHKKL